MEKESPGCPGKVRAVEDGVFAVERINMVMDRSRWKPSSIAIPVICISYSHFRVYDPPASRNNDVLRYPNYGDLPWAGECGTGPDTGCGTM